MSNVDQNMWRCKNSGRSDHNPGEGEVWLVEEVFWWDEAKCVCACASMMYNGQVYSKVSEGDMFYSKADAVEYVLSKASLRDVMFVSSLNYAEPSIKSMLTTEGMVLLVSISRTSVAGPVHKIPTWADMYESSPPRWGSNTPGLRPETTVKKALPVVVTKPKIEVPQRNSPAAVQASETSARDARKARLAALLQK